MNGKSNCLNKEGTFPWFGMIYFSWDHSRALFLLVEHIQPSTTILGMVLPVFFLGSLWLLSCYGNRPISAPALFGMCGRMSDSDNRGWCWCSCFEASLQLVLRFFYHFLFAINLKLISLKWGHWVLSVVMTRIQTASSIWRCMMRTSWRTLSTWHWRSRDQTCAAEWQNSTVWWVSEGLFIPPHFSPV